MPAAAVIRRWQALSGIIGRKARVGGFKSDVKAHGSTVEGHWKLENLSAEEESGIPCVAVKCAEIWRTPVAKATFWSVTDADVRKRGDQTGLDTLVVHAVNDEC